MPNPKWTICITTSGSAPFNEALFMGLPYSHAQVIVVCPKSYRESKLTLPEEAQFIHLGDFPTGYKPASAYYALRDFAQGEYVLFLHDDVSIFTNEIGRQCPDLWRYALEAFERPFRAPFVGMVATHLLGDDRNPDQTFREHQIPFNAWFNTAKPVSSCAFALRNEFLQRYDLSWSYLYDGYVTELQAQLTHEGAQIALQPGLIFDHKGFATYGPQALNPNNQDGFKTAMRAHDYRVLAAKLGWPMLVGQAPVIPPLTGIPVDTAWCAGDARHFSEMQEGQHCLALTYKQASKQWRHQDLRLWAGNNPTLQEAINLTSAKQVIVADEEGYQDYEVVLKLGEEQSIPSLMGVIEIAAYRLCGLGDTLMFSAAIEAFHRRYPRLKINLYVGHWFDLWNGFEYLTLKDAREGVPPTAVDLCILNGNEGTPGAAFEVLGLSDIPLNERAMTYHLLPGESSLARQALIGYGVKEGDRLLGLQLHGGWPSKAWSRIADFAKLAVDNGFQVLLFGQEKSDDNPHHQLYDFKLSSEQVATFEGVGVINLVGKTDNLRSLAAIIAQCEILVGFDSALPYLANALGVKSVILYAAQDPKGYIEMIGANAPYQALWKAWPGMQEGCYCRSRGEGWPDGTGGQSCVLKNRPKIGNVPIGSGCIDVITPEEVMSAVKELVQ